MYGGGGRVRQMFEARRTGEREEEPGPVPGWDKAEPPAASSAGLAPTDVKPTGRATRQFDQYYYVWDFPC